MRLGLEFYRKATADERQFIGFQVSTALVQLGYLEEASKLSGLPPFALLAWRNDPKAIDMVEALELPPRGFWTPPVLPLAHNRMRMNHRRDSDVLRDYRPVGYSPEGLEAAIGSFSAFVEVAPTFALALAQSGQVDQAAQLIAAADKAHSNIVNSVVYRLVGLAHIRAMHGRKREAMELLSKLFNDGWRPEIPSYLPDLALDPPLATLRSKPGFERIRTATLAHLAKERRSWDQFQSIEPEKVRARILASVRMSAFHPFRTLATLLATDCGSATGLDAWPAAAFGLLH